MRDILISLILLITIATTGCPPTSLNVHGTITRMTRVINIPDGSQSVLVEVTCNQNKFIGRFDGGAAAAINSSGINIGDAVIFSAIDSNITNMETVLSDDKLIVVEGQDWFKD